MNQDIINTYKTDANIFKALSHPTRLFIVHELNVKSCNVGELARKIEIDISTMSKHLDILKHQGIISGIKDKNNIYYSLDIPCVLDFMACAVKIKQRKN